MKRIISLTVITASALILSGCMAVSNKALTISAKPTTYDGYWTGSGGGHQINWFIRPDGTGILCEVTTYSGSTLVQDLVVVDNQVHYTSTFDITKIDNNHIKAETFGGLFTLNMKKMNHSPVACSQYFK